MNGTDLLLDTNTILYFLSGDETISEFISGRKLFISIITELELLSYQKLTTKELKILNAFLSEIQIENINEEIKHTTIQLRRNTKLKLPDSIIAATAIALQLPLLSADKQLATVKGLDLILFEK
jgi:predicted nucleic acid-binding protein